MPADIVAPPTDDTRIDLDAIRAARAKAVTDPLVIEAPVEPDPDVVADPELATEIDTLEAPKAEESPQDKAARTKRHKQAAIKGRITKLAQARDSEKARADAAERERDDLRARVSADPGTRRAADPQPGVKAGETTPAGKPKPALKDFPLETFKDDEDPYQAQSIALAEAVADWKWDQRDTAARASRHAEQAEQDERRVAETFDQKATEAKARIADYDAVIGAYTLPQQHPVSPHLFALVTRSDVGPDIAYHLGKHRDVLDRLMASRTRDALLIAFAEVQADVKGALTAAKTPPVAPPKVNAAPEPAQPVSSGAGTGAILRNPMQDDGTAIDLDAVRAFRRASVGRR